MARHVKVDLSLCLRQAQILFAFIIREGKDVNKNGFNIWKKVFFSAIIACSNVVGLRKERFKQ